MANSIPTRSATSRQDFRASRDKCIVEATLKNPFVATAALGAKYGCSQPTVSRALTAAGLDIFALRRQARGKKRLGVARKSGAPRKAAKSGPFRKVAQLGSCQGESQLRARIVELEGIVQRQQECMREQSRDALCLRDHCDDMTNLLAEYEEFVRKFSESLAPCIFCLSQVWEAFRKDYPHVCHETPGAQQSED